MPLLLLAIPRFQDLIIFKFFSWWSAKPILLPLNATSKTRLVDGNFNTWSELSNSAKKTKYMQMNQEYFHTLQKCSICSLRGVSCSNVLVL